MSLHPSSGHAHAPWTSAQANRIEGFQNRSGVHPLTCFYHSDEPLVVTLDGLKCPSQGCDYLQTWVHSQIAGPR